MPGNFKKEDLRIIKTYRALVAALNKLLESQSFSKISVFDICAEALVSRAAFYSHFRDKYDLLDYYLQEQKKDFLRRNRNASPQQAEEILCEMYLKNAKKLNNLLEFSDAELLQIVCGFFAPEIELSERGREENRMSARHAVLSDFLAGALMNLSLQQAKKHHTAEEEIKAKLAYIRELFEHVLEWDKANEKAAALNDRT
jgi:AcrR family transcriptional regulator